VAFTGSSLVGVIALARLRTRAFAHVGCRGRHATQAVDLGLSHQDGVCECRVGVLASIVALIHECGRASAQGDSQLLKHASTSLWISSVGASTLQTCYDALRGG
jgi:hypothetical protein